MKTEQIEKILDGLAETSWQSAKVQVAAVLKELTKRVLKVEERSARAEWFKDE